MPQILRQLRLRLKRPVFLWALAAFLTEFEVERIAKDRVHLPVLVLLLPVVLALLFMVALVRAIQKMDELQKRICLESTYIAFMLTLTLTFVFSGLERAGLYSAPWDSLGDRMMLFWAFSYICTSWRYR